MLEVIPTDAPATEVPLPTDDAAAAESSGSLSQDAIAGIVIGTIGGVLLLVLVAMYIYDRRTETKNQPQETPKQQIGPGHEEEAGGGGVSQGAEAPSSIDEDTVKPGSSTSDA